MLISQGIGGIPIDQLTVLLIWLFPIIFGIHDFEEIIVVEKWVSKNMDDLINILPQRASTFFEKNFAKKTNQFSLVVYVEFILISLATILVFLNGFHEWYKWLYLGLFAGFFLHSFTHIGQSLFLKRYTPGVITSILFIIPYGVWFYYVFLENNILIVQDIWISIPIGVLLFALFFPPLMKSASKF
ncbi:hypothetical protein J2Y67_004897 [Neobacillus niacini]|nr:hypothetical protein [Neobacillus niacini]